MILGYELLAAGSWLQSPQAYSSGRFRSKDQPKIPVRRTSGSGAGGGATSACGGGGGTGKFSHFIEYTSLPSAVRPIGAQLSTRAVVLLGTNFVCAHAGDEIRRIARTSFFIGFSRATRCSTPIEPDRAGEVQRSCGAGQSAKAWPPAGYLAAVSAAECSCCPGRGLAGPAAE